MKTNKENTESTESTEIKVIEINPSGEAKKTKGRTLESEAIKAAKELNIEYRGIDMSSVILRSRISKEIASIIIKAIVTAEHKGTNTNLMIIALNNRFSEFGEKPAIESLLLQLKIDYTYDKEFSTFNLDNGSTITLNDEVNLFDNNLETSSPKNDFSLYANVILKSSTNAEKIKDLIIKNSNRNYCNLHV